MNNAFKYGKKDYPITISCNRKNEGLEIAVQNQGKKIEPEVLKNIFNRYYQIDGSSKGWGIGLPFVKKVAEAHGGIIEVDSKGDDGTTFRLFIPENQD